MGCAAVAAQPIFSLLAEVCLWISILVRIQTMMVGTSRLLLRPAMSPRVNQLSFPLLGHLPFSPLRSRASLAEAFVCC